MTHASIGLIEPRVFIENRTFDEIEVDESATLDRTLSRADIELFAVMSGETSTPRTWTRSTPAMPE